MTRHNIRHGQRRRMPRSVRVPVLILMVEIGVLLALVPVFIEVVIRR